jgi:hypothetical protein
MAGAETSEYTIGPFSYDDAVETIRKYALALTNLGLNKRFVMDASPRPVTEYEKRWDGKKGRKITCYQAVLLDKCPDQPKPRGLTALQIKAAEDRGYKKSA